MKNKLNLTSKIATSLVFAVSLFVAIALGNYSPKIQSEPEADQCTKKCEQKYQKAVQTCKLKYKNDLAGLNDCTNTAKQAKSLCEGNCNGNQSSSNETSRTNPQTPEGEKCHNKCEQTYQKAVQTCKRKYKDSGKVNECQQAATSAKDACNLDCNLQYGY